MLFQVYVIDADGQTKKTILNYDVSPIQGDYIYITGIPGLQTACVNRRILYPAECFGFVGTLICNRIDLGFDYANG